MMVHAAPQTAPLSQVHKDAAQVGTMLEDGPVMMMKSSNSFGMLVSIEQWNKIAEALAQAEFLEEIIQLQQMEIDRLKNGEEDGEFDIAHLEKLAGRVPA